MKFERGDVVEFIVDDVNRWGPMKAWEGMVAIVEKGGDHVATISIISHHHPQYKHLDPHGWTCDNRFLKLMTKAEL